MEITTISTTCFLLVDCPTSMLSYFNKDPHFPRWLDSSHLHTQRHAVPATVAQIPNNQNLAQDQTNPSGTFSKFSNRS
jgi:hypothetical protein